MNIASLKKMWLLILLLTLHANIHAACTDIDQTWVSGTGSNSNCCGRSDPCLTFTNAIVVTNPGGEVSVLDPGDYGTCTITKSITIDGGPARGSISAANNNDGITITALDTDIVILRNLDISGVNGKGRNGITYVSGGKVIIENCNIYGFTNNGILVQSNNNKACNFIINNCTLSNCNNAGLIISLVDSNKNISLSNVIIENNKYGVFAQNTNIININNCTLSNNSLFGITATDSIINCMNSNLSFNPIGIGCSNATVRIANNDFFNNAANLQINGGTIETDNNNHFDSLSGNHPTGAILFQ